MADTKLTATAFDLDLRFEVESFQTLLGMTSWRWTTMKSALAEGWLAGAGYVCLTAMDIKHEIPLVFLEQTWLRMVCIWQIFAYIIYTYIFFTVHINDKYEFTFWRTTRKANFIGGNSSGSILGSSFEVNWRSCFMLVNWWSTLVCGC